MDPLRYIRPWHLYHSCETAAWGQHNKLPAERRASQWVWVMKWVQLEGRGQSRPWSAATAPRNASLTAVTTWRRYCFLSRLLRAPKKPTRRLLMMGPPGRSSALIRRNTLSTRGWALCRRRSLPFPLWRVCRCTASYFTNFFFFFFFFLFHPPLSVVLSWRQLCF